MRFLPSLQNDFSPKDESAATPASSPSWKDVDKFLEENIETVGKIARTAVHDATSAETFFTAQEIATLLKRHFMQAEKEGIIYPPKEQDKAAFLAASANRVMRTLTQDEKLCPAYEKNGETLYTAPKLIKAEKAIKDHVTQTAKQPPKIKTNALLETSVKLNSAYKEHFNYVSLKDHSEGIRQALKEDRGLTIVDGAPGCGKTAIAEGLFIGKMIEAKGEPLTVVTTAPTEKAAGTFVSDLKATADFLKPYVKTPVQIMSMPLFQSIRKMHTGELPKNTLIMMDEAGMLGTRTMAAFLKGMKKSGAEALIIGDGSQIQPEKAGHGFRLLVETAEKNNMPFIRLTQNIRQRFKEDKEAAYLIREGKTAEGMRIYRDKTYANNKKSLNFVEEASDALQKAAADYVQFHKENPDKEAIMIATCPDQAAEANRIIREEMKRTGSLGIERTYGLGGSEQKMAIGDRIILRRTVLLGPEEGHINPGTTGLVKGFDNDHRIKLELEDGRKVSLVHRLGKMDHAHALSLRESQGITKDAAFVAVTKEMDAAETLVALTRHKSQVVTHIPKTIYKDFDALSEKIKMTKKAIISDITEPTPPPPSTHSYATQIRQSLMRDIMEQRQKKR